MKPLVSVIVPTYNRLPLLRQAIASVLGQTFTDLELIVVDDGSQDGTLDYLHALGEPRLRVLSCSHCGNVARLRNAGVRAAQGESLAFLDSDDLWLPRKLEVQLEAMERAGVRWSYTRYEHIDVDGHRVPWASGEWRALSGFIALGILRMEAAVALCTCLVRRTLFDAVGGFDEDPRLNLREDYHLLARLAAAAPTVAVAELLALVREHAGRSTRAQSKSALLLATAYAYDRLAAVLPSPILRRNARRMRGRYRRGAAAELLRAGQPLRAAALFGPALLDVLRSWWDPAPQLVRGGRGAAGLHGRDR